DLDCMLKKCDDPVRKLNTDPAPLACNTRRGCQMPMENHGINVEDSCAEFITGSPNLHIQTHLVIHRLTGSSKKSRIYNSSCDSAPHRDNRVPEGGFQI
ncbi:hypothetical protein HAX54_047072, partial [Datura stramonium]|nr:hypothetical protein [Datura stramonium]